MGGAYGAEHEAEMQQRWAASSAEVRRRRGRPIVPAAQLRVGLGVHRALLFKFLADASNVPCRLVGCGACQGEPSAVRCSSELCCCETMLAAQCAVLLTWSGLPSTRAVKLIVSSVGLKPRKQARCCTRRRT
jgi:Ethylene-responsive protein kinase Le-CTR1